MVTALEEYYSLVDKATKNPAIVAPSELNFVPGAGDDLESMIWERQPIPLCLIIKRVSKDRIWLTTSAELLTSWVETRSA